MRVTTILLSVVLFALAAGPAPAVGAEYAHKEYFEHYEGTKTCLECHEGEATDFFHTRHYQWKGASPEVANADGESIGKANSVNDFCTSPGPNWIGAVKNPDGVTLARGCSACHAGLGKPPEAEVSQEQLENIDCLICHASGYRRDVYQDEAGDWEWRPILYKNQRGLDSVSKRISNPDRTMCLRCHSAAGGGPNFKRGDIEYALVECEPEFDVHMAKSGNDMSCVDCHGGNGHHIRGRGADLAGPDPASDPLSCTSCHGQDVHGIAILDAHTTTVDCATCHIPYFAKGDPTDMVRDWSTPKYHEDGNKYSATITLESNVVPAYAWFDGTSTMQKASEPVERNAEGKVVLAAPVGSRGAEGAKIAPFKLHRGKLPVLADRQLLAPIAVEEFFADGQLDHAIAEGIEHAFGEHDVEVEWVETERWMGIYHEVSPARQALQCQDCHREGGRMDWAALGYEGDPFVKKTGR